MPSLVLVVVVTASLTTLAQDRPWQPTPLPPAAEPTPVPWCDPPDRDGIVRRAALADGGALSFGQDPPWLMPRDDHGMALRRFTVAGDVDRVRFDRWDTDTGGFIEETWGRTRSDTIDGRLVSIFEPSWPASVIQARLGRSRVGLDNPALWLGNYRGPADAPSVTHALFVRVGSTAIGPATVVRIDDTVQYASHVVNLVMPGVGAARLGGDFDLRAVARRFYAHFEDQYDVLAVVPRDAHLDANGAYHQRVRNDIAGLGLTLFDRAAEYGSAGRLRGVELFFNARLGGHYVSSHELGHVWGHNFDWTRIAGITRAGHQPVSHAPLFTGGESVLSGVLAPTRRIAVRTAGDAVVEAAPAPLRQHPLDLYAMGLVTPSDLPPFTLFDAQGQFSMDTTAEPAPGTVVTGGRQTITINDVMAAHGPRQGPVLTELRRATIVVSDDALLPPEEMAMWNALAARHEDATGSGAVDYTGQASFDLSTGRRIDLTTVIQPRDVPALPRTQDPEPPRFGARDCRGIEFSTPPPTRVRAGQRFTVAGRVTARDRSDYHQALIRFWPSDDMASKEEEAYAEVSRAGEFRVDVEIRAGREGQYSVDGFLFWPGAPPQYPRCRMSVLTVAP